MYICKSINYMDDRINYMDDRYQLKFHTFSSSRFDIDRQYKWSKPIQ